VDVHHQEAEKGGQDRITLRLSLGGDLTAEQQARLRAISRRCPVHRLLAGGAEIVEE
jgi:uncharacterized OsmC-like protein